MHVVYILYITEPTKDQCLKNIYSSFYSSFKNKYNHSLKKEVIDLIYQRKRFAGIVKLKFLQQEIKTKQKNKIKTKRKIQHGMKEYKPQIRDSKCFW